jgi:hypothetical protein
VEVILEGYKKKWGREVRGGRRWNLGEEGWKTIDTYKEPVDCQEEESE